MADYNVVPLVATGDWIDDAWLNTYIRDNFAALWPYTTAGDMAFAIDGNTLGRLSITGATGKQIGVVAGLPAWVDGVPGMFVAAGDLPVGTGADTGTVLPIGSPGKQLGIFAGMPAWVDGVPGIFTTTGDLVVGTGNDTAARLALVVGGFLYGGASLPSWLAKPTSGMGFLYQTTGNAPGWASSTSGYGIPRINSGATAGEIFIQAETSRAYRATSLASVTINETAILFDAESEDSNWHDNSTNSERITPISSGRYRCTAMMQITNNSGVSIDGITLSIKTSTGLILGGVTFFGLVAGGSIFMSVTGYSYDLTAGQYITLVTSRSNVSSPVTIEATQTWLQVERVR